MPSIDVIIPFHNNLSATVSCLSSVLENSPEFVRALLVDNGSEAQLPGWLKGSDRIRVLRNHSNLGWTGGVNRAFRESKADYVVLLNNDTLVFSGWLETMLAAMDERPALGAVGALQQKGAYLASDGTLRLYVQSPEGIAEDVPDMPLYSDFLTFDDFRQDLKERFRGQVLPVQRLSFFCVMLRADAVSRVGELDERFAYGYDDDDYSLRLIADGWELGLALDTVIFHDCGATFRSLASDYMSRLAQDEKYFRTKHNLPDARSA
jgi:GT2 family glycosyltransferase